VIGHSGSGEPMESMLLLLPDENLGVFVAYNSLGAGELNRQHFGFQRAFFDHYYSAPALEPIQPPADFAERADHFMGAYKWTMSSYTTFEKYFSLMGPTIYVKNPGDGTLLLESPFGDWRIVEEEPMYFRFVDNSYHIAFREDEQGRIVYLFTDLTPMMSFEKVQWYETLGFNMPLLMISLLMFLFMLLVALVRFIQERRRGAGQKPFSTHRWNQRPQPAVHHRQRNVGRTDRVWHPVRLQNRTRIGRPLRRTDCRRTDLHRAGVEGQLLGYRLPRLLYAGDAHGSCVYLVFESVESVGLAVLNIVVQTRRNSTWKTR
jgi:hypothetical protein